MSLSGRLWSLEKMEREMIRVRDALRAEREKKGKLTKQDQHDLEELEGYLDLRGSSRKRG